MNETLCTHCGLRVAKHEEGKQALCQDCMDALELSWDRDEYEFVASRRTCHTCGGIEEWCNCCATYDCHDCNPYGTCGCS